MLLDGISDRAMAGLHGLSRGEDYGTVEREEPELLALVTQRLPSCPPGLPLYLLQEGDCRAFAATVSCGQARTSPATGLSAWG